MFPEILFHLYDKFLEIDEVKDFYYGENISLRGLDKGFTHIITMKFKNSYDMDSIYLPHPIHKEFSAIFRIPIGIITCTWDLYQTDT